jgi:hypothetical protein
MEEYQISNEVFNDYDIRSLIHFIRNQQVMLDSDLAMLYQVETGRLNEAVSRNMPVFRIDSAFSSLRMSTQT